MKNKKTTDLFGSEVRIGDLVAIPSPSGVLLDRRDLVQGKVTKVFPKSVEVFLRTGQGGFIKAMARSFILVPQKPTIDIVVDDLRYRVWYNLVAVQGLNKNWVFQTTCSIKIGSCRPFYGSVTNHKEDDHRAEVGRIEASKKAFAVVKSKEAKKLLWDKLLNRGAI